MTCLHCGCSIVLNGYAIVDGEIRVKEGKFRPSKIMGGICIDCYQLLESQDLESDRDIDLP